MKSLEIYYHDLSLTARCEFDHLFGPPEDFNHEIAPLFIYEQEDKEQEPTPDCRHSFYDDEYWDGKWEVCRYCGLRRKKE